MKKALIGILITAPFLMSCQDEPQTRRTVAPKTNIEKLDVSESEEIIKYLSSQSHRDKSLRNNEKILSISDELEALRGTGLPTHYRSIPEVNYDDDGLESTLTRPTAECGLTAKTTLAAMADCSKKNGSKAYPKGKSFGKAGEGNWKLVARDNDGNEVWMDMKTQLLWSDVLPAANWCKASGNQEEAGGINCDDLADAQRHCQSDAFSLSKKGELDSALVSWKLPTRGEFLQADLNGARIVLPNSDNVFWTSTVSSADRAKAWTYHGRSGMLEADTRSKSKTFRCVGRILK